MHIIEIIRQAELEPLDIKLLIRYVTGFSSVELITHNDYPLNKAQLLQLNALIQRRKNGEPLHYILGYKEFYSREFIVTPDTLIPRPETELLVEKVLEITNIIAKQNIEILDLGTGSGCIAITCKLENPLLQIYAVDKYQATLDIAIKNAKQLGADIKFILSDWFDFISDRFDIIVSNPPYIALADAHLNDLQFEPQYALTDAHDGLKHIKHIITYAHNYLNQNGYLLFEHAYNQGKLVRELFQANAFTNVETLQDYSGLDRITLGKHIN